MSLSMREQQALDGIEKRLADSDPRLAGLLVTFARLTSGDAMPISEEVRTLTRWTHLAGQRVRRLLAAYAGLDRAMALLWVLIAVGLIAVAVAFSGGSGGRCVRAWALACAIQAPAHPHHLVVPSAS